MSHVIDPLDVKIEHPFFAGGWDELKCLECSNRNVHVGNAVNCK